MSKSGAACWHRLLSVSLKGLAARLAAGCHACRSGITASPACRVPKGRPRHHNSLSFIPLGEVDDHPETPPRRPGPGRLCRRRAGAERHREDRRHPADDGPIGQHRAPDRRRHQAVGGAERQARPAGKNVEVHRSRTTQSLADTRRAAWHRNWWSTTRWWPWPASASRRSALAVAPIATQSKTPMVVMAAATSSHHRGHAVTWCAASFTLPQAAVSLADWSATRTRHQEDRHPGGRLRPRLRRRKVLRQTSIHPQRRPGAGKAAHARCAAPDFSRRCCRRCATWQARCACSSSCPPVRARQFMKQFGERGLDKAGIKLIATGDVTDDDQLNDIGDVALGVVNSPSLLGARTPERNEQEVRRRLPGRQQVPPELHGRGRL